MSRKNYYITSPIYYVNASPHIGHLYTSIICDTITRIMQLQGHQVKFTTGTDEHGQKIEQAALKNQQSPLAFADKVSADFQEMMQNLKLKNTDFIRTTEIRHKKNVEYIWKKLLEKDYIYLGKYSGFYCVREEAFFQEKDLIDGKTPDGNEVTWHEEESYFFRLSKLENSLLEFYDNNPEFIVPKHKLNEVKQFVKKGLNDLSISRTTINWGIPVPDHPQHTIYVWIDALANYLSSLGFAENQQDFQNFWLNGLKIQVLGKDILRFHAIYWPAILLALDLPLPDKLIVHGWWLMEDQKISKSLGNIISSQELIDNYDHDCLRYFLLKEMPSERDGNFSFENLQSKINNELINNFGNLVQRTFNIAEKKLNFHCITIKELLNDEQFASLMDHLHQDSANILEEIENLNLYQILNKIIALSTQANSILNQFEPWKIKDDTIKLQKIITCILYYILIITVLMQPFIPEKSQIILQLFDIKNEVKFQDLKPLLDNNLKIKSNIKNKLFTKIL